MYGPDCVGRIHKKLLEKAGIEEHVRFHDLRHTFSTLAIQSGIDPKTVAEILGHASAEFSLDVYTHVTAGMKKKPRRKSAASWQASDEKEQKAHTACRKCSGRRRFLTSGAFRPNSRLGRVWVKRKSRKILHRKMFGNAEKSG